MESVIDYTGLFVLVWVIITYGIGFILRRFAKLTKKVVSFVCGIWVFSSLLALIF